MSRPSQVTLRTLFLQRTLYLPHPASADPEEVAFAALYRGLDPYGPSPSPEPSEPCDAAQRSRVLSKSKSKPRKHSRSPSPSKARKPRRASPQASESKPSKGRKPCSSQPASTPRQPSKPSPSQLQVKPRKTCKVKGKRDSPEEQSVSKPFRLPKTFDGSREDSPLTPYSSDLESDCKVGKNAKMSTKREADSGPATPRKKQAKNEDAETPTKSPGGRKAAVPWTTEETLALHRGMMELALKNLKDLGQTPGLENRVSHQLNHKLRSECKKILESIGGKAAADWVDTIKIGGATGGATGSGEKKPRGKKAAAAAKKEEEQNGSGEE